jgi:hypothetical protein
MQMDGKLQSSNSFDNSIALFTLDTKMTTFQKKFGTSITKTKNHKKNSAVDSTNLVEVKEI